MSECRALKVGEKFSGDAITLEIVAIEKHFGNLQVCHIDSSIVRKKVWNHISIFRELVRNLEAR